MTADARAARTTAADGLCAQTYTASGAPLSGAALVAVGGYGRGELAPGSDLDLVLVLDPERRPGQWAADLWYPLWDSGRPVDHAVRTVPEVLERATADLRVALGLLDLRHLAGDPNLTLRLRSDVLTQWRRDARLRLAELRELAEPRGRRLGELAHAAVPDLKESAGGLRDATVLRGLVASWLVDVPHRPLESSRLALLDVRDALHTVAGRATDRVAPDVWADLAAELGHRDADDAQRHVRVLGRRIAHLSRLTWRRAEAVGAAPARTSGVRRPELARLAAGVARAGPEVVLASGADPAGDPMLLLRASAEAAERGLELSPATAARLAREAPPLPEPWPAPARDLLVRLLGAGPGLRPVWETLDETGAVARVLPEWERVRLLPHASVIHRFTVDRHLVETCVEASALIRGVGRPDVLLVSALLHDLGKGEDAGPNGHAASGEPVARAVATRIGLDARGVDLVGTLVRRHLLLPELATTRDIEDPATVSAVLAAVPDRETLDLLAALTEADGRATSERAWTAWRAGLVTALVRRTAAGLDGSAPAQPVGGPRLPPPSGEDPGRLSVAVGPADHGGARVTVTAPDRIGLLAASAAALALHRVSIQAMRAWTDGRVARSVWDVDDADIDPARLRERLEGVWSGSIDAALRLRRTPAARLAASVVAHPAASADATVLEVRAQDRPGLIHDVCRCLAGLGVSIRSAHVDTLGPQAVDAFYVQESAVGASSSAPAAALSEPRTAAAVAALLAALAFPEQAPVGPGVPRG